MSSNAEPIKVDATCDLSISFTALSDIDVLNSDETASAPVPVVSFKFLQKFGLPVVLGGASSAGFFSILGGATSACFMSIFGDSVFCGGSLLIITIIIDHDGDISAGLNTGVGIDVSSS